MKAFIWLSRGSIVFVGERLCVNVFVHVSLCTTYLSMYYGDRLKREEVIQPTKQ